MRCMQTLFFIITSISIIASQCTHTFLNIRVIRVFIRDLRNEYFVKFNILVNRDQNNELIEHIAMNILIHPFAFNFLGLMESSMDLKY